MSDKLPSRVTIREVGPREGFQTTSSVLPTADKLEIISLLTKTGLSDIEVSSFVRPDKVPQLADVDDVVRGVPTTDASIRFSALYLNHKGFIRAMQYPQLNTKGWIATSASDSFLKRNTNSSKRDDLQGVAEWCSLFSSHGKTVHGLMLSNSFGCAYEGEINPKQVMSLIKEFQDSISLCGETLQEVCLADTVGMGTPRIVEELVKGVQDLGMEPSLHLHNTRGLGLVNAYEGLQHGVSIFESSVGGVGGCPFTKQASGNIATEELVYLCNSLGIESGVKFDSLIAVACRLEEILGAPLSGTLYKTHRK
jgi:hydroxymethylglutaryl-CoA lyase